MRKKNEELKFPKGTQLICKNCNVKAFNLLTCPLCQNPFTLAEPEQWMVQEEMKREEVQAAEKPSKTMRKISFGAFGRKSEKEISNAEEEVLKETEDPTPAQQEAWMDFSAEKAFWGDAKEEPVAAEEDFFQEESGADFVVTETEIAEPAEEETTVVPECVDETAVSEPEKEEVPAASVKKAFSGFSFAGLMKKKISSVEEEAGDAAVNDADCTEELVLTGIPVVDELKRCKRMLDAGEMTQEEFEAKKAELLDL